MEQDHAKGNDPDGEKVSRLERMFPIDWLAANVGAVKRVEIAHHEPFVISIDFTVLAADQLVSQRDLVFSTAANGCWQGQQELFLFKVAAANDE